MRASLTSHYWQSPFGLIRLESDGKAITALTFAQGRSQNQDELPVFDQAVEWLSSYFRGNRQPPGFSICLDTTDFCRCVYKATATIPYGQTASYGQIARSVSQLRGITASPRAVGQALGKNPLMLIIPCHRIIGSDGSLKGFRGGKKLKENLLRHEGVIITGKGREK